MSQKTARFSAQLEASTNKLWGAHFIVPGTIATRFLKDTTRRVVCSINGAPGFQCGILRGLKTKFVITVNATIRKKLKLEFGDTMQIVLREDDSEYGLPITEEMKAALELDEDGSEYFHKLTPGKQRTLLYIASNVKSPDARALRAVAILDHLRETAGEIDFKRLNAAIKATKAPR